ncbi:MAG: toprim domain-containing protein [Muribaculaceae bacterium]|nr:toprim domain-containing protein [Muribaculaceae bacterium]
MADLTYDDFKRMVDIQDVLQYAGYRLNRRDGMRYPSYVKMGSDGRRVHGDKFIVTSNGLCCFQPPQQKNYNVISFIKEHPELFSDYNPGMSKDRLVNIVCNRILNRPIENRPVNIERERPQKVFNIFNYNVTTFDNDNWDSQKKFYPYFKNRGIDIQTQRVFSGHFFLASSERTDGKQYTNLSFPLTLAKWPGKEIVGMEERSRPNADGKTAYKGMAAGSNAQEGLWIARLENHRSDHGFSKPIGKHEDIYWFESAFDAMAFYQLQMKNHPEDRQKIGNAVFVSTGGSPSNRQFSSLIEQTPEATHHLCFDRDRAGQMFSINFALQHNKKIFTSHLTPDKSKLIVTDLTKALQRHEIALGSYDFKDICSRLGLVCSKIGYEPCDPRYKDWNDQLLDKPILEEMSDKMSEEMSEISKENKEQEERQSRGFRR